MKRNAKEEIIVNALLNYGSVAEAAKMTNIPKRTIYDYFGRESFQQKYNEARADILRGVTNSIESKLSTAVDTIASIMKSEKTNAQIKLNAAKVILEYSEKFAHTEQTLMRIQKLEDLHKGEKT